VTEAANGRAAGGFDPALLNPPWPFYERLRAHAPVFKVEEVGFWLVTRYADVDRVLKDSDTFSNEFPHRFGTGLSFLPATPAKEAAHARGYRWEPTLFFSDGANHRRHRNAVQQAFSPRRVRQLEDLVQRLCDEIIDNLDTTGPIDFAREVAFELPTMVIGEALGVAVADRPRFRVWADAVVTRLGEQLSEEEDIALIEHYVDAQHYFAAEIAGRQAAPTDDLLSDLVTAHLGAEDPLTLEELLAIVTILPVAGTETSAGLIGMAFHRLLDDPAEMARCRRDPGHIDRVIEETLRHQSPIQAWFRRATRDVELSGATVPKDEMVLVVLASANRDEARWSCPAEFRTDRADVRDNVSFGRGRHFCVGASLARAEARIAIATMLERFPDARLAPGAEPAHRPNLVHRMLQTLPIVVTPPR
jgi:cytochrome P450